MRRSAVLLCRNCVQDRIQFAVGLLGPATQGLDVGGGKGGAFLVFLLVENRTKKARNEADVTTIPEDQEGLDSVDRTFEQEACQNRTSIAACTYHTGHRAQRFLVDEGNNRIGRAFGHLE